MPRMDGVTVEELVEACELRELPVEVLGLWLASQEMAMSEEDWEVLRLERRFLLDMDELHPYFSDC